MRSSQPITGGGLFPFLPLFLALLLFPQGAAQGQQPLLPGEPAAAEQYLRWAQNAVAEGRWPEALAALERAADYGDLSSDLSYLLARARLHQGRPQGAVLEALRRGLAADRWKAYSAGAARLIEAAALITLRSFPEALRALALSPQGIEASCLRLRALRGIPDAEGFWTTLEDALDRYPQDPRPVRILFETLQGAPFTASPSAGGAAPPQPLPSGPGRSLLDTALKRLPRLLEEDGELAYLAVPFIADTAEARRLVAAYRAIENPNPASIPAALALGVIGEGTALEELFHPYEGESLRRGLQVRPLASTLQASAPPPAGALPPQRPRREVEAPPVPPSPWLDRGLLRSVWPLLRTEESRRQYTRNLSAFSGFIQEDMDRDGYAEAAARYAHGQAEHYALDEDQDGLPDLTVSFRDGAPQWAEALISPEGPSPEGTGFAYPVRAEEQPRAFLRWEQYPAVASVTLGTMHFAFRPQEFFYAPLRLVEGPGGALLYPEGDLTRISRRTLIALAFLVERPGRDFEGAVEQVELDQGIPRRAREFLEGQLVSETEFLRGRPRVQRIDLDLDGRLETVRRFREDPAPLEGYLQGDDRGTLESAERDGDGDGIFETGEDYLPDGSVKRIWDITRNGIKEYEDLYKKD